jgi:hypothetical protein
MRHEYQGVNDGRSGRRCGVLADRQREARAGVFSAGRTPPEPFNNAATCLGCRNGVPDFPWCTSTQASPPE